MINYPLIINNKNEFENIIKNNKGFVLSILKETENQDYQYEEKILKFLRNFPGNKKKYINPKDDMVEKFSISTPNLRDLKENDPKRLSYIEPQSRNSSSPLCLHTRRTISSLNRTT